MAATAAGAMVPLAAQAQLVDRFLLDQYFQAGVPGTGEDVGVTVLSRARPAYDPPGVPVGDFIIRPELDESVGYNSNVLGQKPADGSFTEDTAGSVRFNSNWDRNSLDGQITFDNRIDPSVPSMNRTDWSAAVGGSFEIGRDVLTIAASHYSLHEDPTGIDAQEFSVPGVFSSEPIPYTLDDVRASYTTTFSRFSFTPDVDFTRLTFSNLTLISVNGTPVPQPVNGLVLGIPINQSYQDRDILEGGVTGRYEFSPLRNAVLVVRDYNTEYFSSQANAFGPERSSNAIEVLAGLDYVASAVLRYRALIGYEIRDFQAPQYKSHSAPIVEGNVIWQPSGVTTVTAKVLRSIEDAADEDVQRLRLYQRKIAGGS